MAQHDYVISNGTGAAVRSDLNNALAAIVSQNSGATAPSPTYAFQFWADTTAGVLKLRNSANSAWITLFQLDGEWTTLPVENGTAAAPSIYFKDSGTDTGFYSPGTDQVAISTGGTGRLFINSSGSVGIGTSSPDQLLTVKGTQALQATNSTNAWQVYTYTDNTLRFNYNGAGADEITITSAGNVGIGSTTLIERLHVNGGVRLDVNDQGLYFNSSTTAITGNGTSSYIAFNTSNAEKARLDSSGRWLLGTSTSLDVGTSLQVVGTNNVGEFLSASSDIFGAYLYLAKSRGSIGSPTVVSSGDDLGAVLFRGYDGSKYLNGAAITAAADAGCGVNDLPTRLMFSTTADGASSPTERCRITSDGELFINRTTRDVAIGTNKCKLQVAGDTGEWATVIRNPGAEPYSLLIRQDTDKNNVGNEFISCYGGGNPRFTARSNGGLANYSANNVNLSDINTKKDIAPVAGTWDCIKEWEIVNYRYKDQPDDADLNMGVIAQQVAESCPEVITVFEEAKDDQPEKLGVKEQQMYWMAIKALQEAQVRIEALEAEVAALKAQ